MGVIAQETYNWGDYNIITPQFFAASQALQDWVPSSDVFFSKGYGDFTMVKSDLGTLW